MIRDELAAIITALGDLVQVIRDADGAAQLGPAASEGAPGRHRTRGDRDATGDLAAARPAAKDPRPEDQSPKSEDNRGEEPSDLNGRAAQGDLSTRAAL